MSAETQGGSLRDDKTGGLWESLQKDMSNIFLFISLRKKEEKRKKAMIKILTC